MWSATRARLDDLPLLVTLAQLRAAKLDADIARRAAAAGQWCDVLPGAWLRSPGPVERRHRQEAALALSTPDGMLTGVDACAALGLRDVPHDPLVSLLVPADWRRRLGPEVRVLRTGDEVHSLELAGLRVAEPTRAIVDAARGCGTLRDARALVTAAVADRWAAVHDLRPVLDAGPQRGSGLARRAIDAAAAGCRSAPEAEVAEAVEEAVRRGRLPPYVLNPELFFDGTKIGEPDGWLVGLGLGWEVDSYRHHGSVGDLDATLLRHERFAHVQLELVHITPTRFRRSPAAFIDTLCARAAERRALPVAEPPGLVVVARRSPVSIPPRGRLIIGKTGLYVPAIPARICR